MERAQTKPYFVYMKIFVLFVLFILFGACFKISILFCYLAYIYIIFTFYHLAEAFIQID